jgi:DNA-binding GntR family transcriptional regulator
LAELRNIQSHYPQGKIPYRSSKLAEHFNVAPLTINKWVKTLTKLGILEVEMTASQNQWEQIISVRS